MEEDQYHYCLSMFTNIDCALDNPAQANQFISNGEIHLKVIAPDGVLHHNLNDVVWQIAKQNDIVSDIDIENYDLLNSIYNNRERITASEDKIADVLLSYESGEPQNLRNALILTRDSYHAWNADRAPA